MNKIKLALTLILFIPYVIFSQTRLAHKLGQWRDPDIIGSAAYNNAFNEVWGLWVNGKEYAVIGSTYGTHIIDLSNPSEPKEIFKIKGSSSGAHIIHRDYGDYQCYLYMVCDEGSSSTLQIADISQLPDRIDLVYDSQDLFIRAHNIDIDLKNGILYTCAESSKAGFNALGVYSLLDPASPTFIGHYNHFGAITAGHVHDCYVKADTVFLNCGGDGFAIMDFKDPYNPKPIFSLRPNEYAHSGYNHSGWGTPDGKLYVMADENHGSPLKLMDIRNITQSKIIDEMFSNGDTTITIPHNPLITCDYVYTSYYYEGLQIHSLKYGSVPELKYYFPTSILPNIKSYAGAWGTYPFLPSGTILVSDMQNGLFVIEAIEKPCNPFYSCGVVSNQNNLPKESSVPTILVQGNTLLVSMGISLKNISFSMYSNTGVLVHSGSFKNEATNEIDISFLESGIYILSLQNPNPSNTKFLIKQH
jgi:choice-of-anchor B domain-containing protein